MKLSKSWQQLSNRSFKISIFFCARSVVFSCLFARQIAIHATK